MNINELLQELEREGFPLSAFERGDFDASMGSIGFTFSQELGISGLETRLYIALYYGLENPLPDTPRFPWEIVLKQCDEFVCHYRPGCSDDDQDIELAPAQYGSVVRNLKEDIALLESLRGYMSTVDPRSAKASISLENSTPAGMLYAKLCREGRLRWFELLGQRFPYVLTDSETILNVGLNYGGLYFVAADVADEPWKERVIAYHERFCRGEKSHTKARRKERQVVKLLGKEKEYPAWREEIDNGF